MRATKRSVTMYKKYIVRLTNEERESLRSVIKKLKGSSQKVRRAQVLLKADADGPGWTDVRIAEAFDCRTRKRSRTSGSTWSGTDSRARSTASNAKPHREPSCSMVTRRPSSSRCGWAAPPRVSPTGRSGGLHNELCNWRSWIPSVRKPSARP